MSTSSTDGAPGRYGSRFPPERVQALADASHAFALLAADMADVSENVVQGVLHVLADAAAAVLRGQVGVVLFPGAEQAPGAAARGGDDHGDTGLALRCFAPRDAAAAAILRGVLAAIAPVGVMRARALLGTAKILRPADLDPAAAVAPLTADTRERLARGPARSLLVVPLCGRRTTLGAVLAVRTAADRALAVADQEWLEELAQRAALALENVRAHDELRGALKRQAAEVVAARRELDGARRMTDELLAKVAHELRTPLGAVLMWAHVLRAGSLTERGAALDAIEASIRMQSRIIGDLLDVSRAVGGKLRIEPTPVDVGRSVGTALAALRPEAVARGVRLSLTVAGGELRVMGDGIRLQQIVSNLVSNGIKFTPWGGRVDVRLAEADDGHVEIVVADSGRGIAPAALPEIFTPFRQFGDLGSRGGGGGLGLGLAIVRQLVDLHGGLVRAESAGEGRGARFTVRLPLAPPALVAPAGGGRRELALAPTPTSTPTPTPTPQIQIRGIRVLLVEDDPRTCRGLELVLRQAGAEVTVAASAAEATLALESVPFDVLLCDLALPDASGIDLLSKLRARDRGGRERMRAVAVTALSDDRDRRRALEAGFDAHLTKPADVRDLLRAVAGFKK